uniref:Uncharacterized protein n=1 Tax=Moniliophthora roreri TaxID=221103 RepID=A0A0W0FKR2_MONRR
MVLHHASPSYYDQRLGMTEIEYTLMNALDLSGAYSSSL